MLHKMKFLALLGWSGWGGKNPGPLLGGGLRGVLGVFWGLTSTHSRLPQIYYVMMLLRSQATCVMTLSHGQGNG